MTSCLNTVSYIALERIYETHGDHLNDIIFANSIGLRMFRPEIGQYMLGFCVGLMPTLYHNEFIDCTDDTELTNSFWRIARQNQLEFEKRVQNDKEKYGYLPPNFDPKLNKLLLIHLGLSNLCVLDTSVLEKSSRP